MKKKNSNESINIVNCNTITFPFEENRDGMGNTLVVGNVSGNGSCGIWGDFASDNFGFGENVIDNIRLMFTTIKNKHHFVVIAPRDDNQYMFKVKRQLMLSDKLKNDYFHCFNCGKEDSFESYVINAQKVVANMKFDNIIINPPYSGSLHLDFLEKSLDCLSENGKLVIIEPATWLINVRKNGKAKRYDDIKKEIKGNIKSVVIENLNKEFGTGLYVPFATTTIDMSKTYDTIDCTICGEHKVVNSIYDCNLVGKYETIWSILDKVNAYGDMMKSHITKENKGEGMWYAKYAEIISANGCGGGNRALSDEMYRTCLDKDYYLAYSASGFHSDRTSDIQNVPCERRDKGGKKLEGTIADNIYGTKAELENWKHFIFNNKLPLFINIVMTNDQHNNSKEYLPWLVDKQYTDEEINEKFGFTEEEVKLIDSTLKKYERNSPWFKRYMCGKDAVSDEEVNNFIKEISK